MHLETFVTIVVPRTIPAINVLFHAMKQRSQRPNRLAQSQLLKNADLVVMVVDADAVMVGGGRGGDRTNTRGKWGTNKGDPATSGKNTSLSDGV
jgi:hypothetical protein